MLETRSSKRIDQTPSTPFREGRYPTSSRCKVRFLTYSRQLSLFYDRFVTVVLNRIPVPHVFELFACPFLTAILPQA